MTRKEAFDKIKALFTSQTLYTEYTLADGVKVKIDKLETGGKVLFVKEDGNDIPATEGTYTLPDKKQVFCDCAGTITEVKAEEVVLDFKEYSLSNGTKVKIDKLEVGGKVNISQPDGTMMAAAAGIHELADGMKLTVDENGVITGVAPKEPVAVAVEELKTAEQMMGAIQKFADGTETDTAKMAVILKAVFENVFGWQLREAQQKATIDAAISAYQTGFKAQFEAQSKELNTYKQGFAQLMDIVEEMLDEPAVTHTEPKKTDAGVFAETKSERFNRMADGMKKLKEERTA
jgi:hypothetical protein